MSGEKKQGMATDQFFYFFLRLRKGEVRRTVQAITASHPEETPEQIALRLISVKSRLAFVGGALMNLPMLWPGVGQALKVAGVVGASSMLTRMHLYLILEIAATFGKDIEDKARIAEMAAVVATTTASSAATPLLIRSLELNPLYAIPAGALSASGVTQLIGRTAIALYKDELELSAGSASETISVAG